MEPDVLCAPHIAFASTVLLRTRYDPMHRQQSMGSPPGCTDSNRLRLPPTRTPKNPTTVILVGCSCYRGCCGKQEASELFDRPPYRACPYRGFVKKRRYRDHSMVGVRSEPAGVSSGCTWSATGMHVERGRDARGARPEYAWDAREVRPGCAWDARGARPGWAWSAAGMRSGCA